jgi:hypothetical protein
MSLSSSRTQLSPAKVARSRTSKVARIAKEIVDLVERTNGPVLLHRLDQEVPGFKANGPRGYNYFITNDSKEVIYWQGMTKPGLDALRSVLSSRRVAVQYVSGLLYFLDGVQVEADAWEPIALLPARAANIDTPKWAIRASPAARAKALNLDPTVFRPLTPKSVRSTADDFCTW